MFKGIDAFDRGVFFVFTATIIVNAFNLLYQLLIAHRLNPEYFAAFNSLIAIFMLVSSPLANLQIVTAKYVADYRRQKQPQKINFLLYSVFRKVLLLAFLTLAGFYLFSSYIIQKLKIPSFASVYILSLLLAGCWLLPIFLGALQGLEFFGWMAVISVSISVLKLLLAFIFLRLGLKITGALGALLLSYSVGLILVAVILRDIFFTKAVTCDINLKDFFYYILPVSVSTFLFMCLVNFDMVAVRYFFNSQESGVYALAQMVGKLILFLPAAVNVVILPHTSGLSKEQNRARLTLKKGLLYAFSLCIFAALIYNIFPNFTLRILTGKTIAESIFLGRFFSVSMASFALLFIIITYFISIKDLRFIKYLFLFTLLQIIAIVLFHKVLIHIQLIMCINAFMLLFIHLVLAFKG
ncbi:MAG: oligosaccharide flippase family protein [Candidatus Omnitrophica bacterium]|nr:oligosaccharide flippase family protein [Candidatus Omnitrophota bacterium]